MVVIEHNLDVIKVSDRLIDLGPEGGDEGGRVIATGTPEEVAAVSASYTGRFLADLLPIKASASRGAGDAPTRSRAEAARAATGPRRGGWIQAGGAQRHARDRQRLAVRATTAQRPRRRPSRPAGGRGPRRRSSAR